MPTFTGKKLEDNFTNKWKFIKVGKTHKTHNSNTPKWNLTRTLKWKLSQILSKNSVAIALYFSQIGMLTIAKCFSIYRVHYAPSWVQLVKTLS